MNDIEEKYNCGLLEVTNIPDEINNNNGKQSIHALSSKGLRIFCNQNKVPLFVVRIRKGSNDNEIRFTKFKDVWIFAYKDEFEQD